MRNLKDKHVLITGAAGGLGRELCSSFGRGGAKIIALDINKDSLTSLKNELSADNIVVSTYICDIADNELCKRVMDKISGNHSSIDVVIQNAGISHRCVFRGMEPNVIQKILAVNINGTINVTLHTLEQVIKSKGTYVVISSVAGFAPLLGRTIYAASKHALHGFFETLRAEVEDQGVNIMVVCPSFIKTPMENNALKGDGKPVEQKKETIGEVLTPTYVAETIYKGVISKKKRLYISPIARLSLFVSRISPTLYNRIMKQRMRVEIK